MGFESSSCNGSCLPTPPPGISLNDLIDLLSDPWFAPCCGGGSSDGSDGSDGTNSGNCDPIHIETTLTSGECIILDIVCCNGTINGNFEVVSCTAGSSMNGGAFCATYQGPPNDPNEFTNPNNWVWCGDTSAPSNILEILANATWLVPCLQQ
jgi:hypothetical protein